MLRLLPFSWFILIIALSLSTGCGRKPVAAPPPPATKKPTGRLVPAVVASFERGKGAWRAQMETPSGLKPVSPELARGSAARGEKWLAIPVSSPSGREAVVEVWGETPFGDWLRFGDTLRADVRMSPGGAKATVQPYLVTTDGQEATGPATDVAADWHTIVWNAGQDLGKVARIGLRWRISGGWTGRLGLDNVRVGAAEALSTAYSVAYGPFAKRDLAVETMKTLKSAGVDCFPIFEEGWYLNLGTFSSRAAADKEAQRLKGDGYATTILVR